MFNENRYGSEKCWGIWASWESTNVFQGKPPPHPKALFNIITTCLIFTWCLSGYSHSPQITSRTPRWGFIILQHPSPWNTLIMWRREMGVDTESGLKELVISTTLQNLEEIGSIRVPKTITANRQHRWSQRTHQQCDIKQSSHSAAMQQPMQQCMVQQPPYLAPSDNKMRVREVTKQAPKMAVLQTKSWDDNLTQARLDSYWVNTKAPSR